MFGPIIMMFMVFMAVFVLMIVVAVMIVAPHAHFMAVRRHESLDAKQSDHAERHPPAKQPL